MGQRSLKIGHMMYFLFSVYHIVERVAFLYSELF